MEQDKRHIPQSSREPHNQQTRPAESQDKDRLRENPHNDERTIAQGDASQMGNPDLRSGSTFAQKDEEDRNQVTNDEEQDEVVNPVGTKWESNADGGDDDEDEDDEDEKEVDPELPALPDTDYPDTPVENPYEGDDGAETQRKIPTM
jgi:hypothetical protein